MSTMISTHVYKVIFPMGEIKYESREKGEIPTIRFSSIISAAETVATTCARFREDNVLFAIDFTPPHDIEVFFNLAPRRCLSFTEEERKEFFQAFDGALYDELGE